MNVLITAATSSEAHRLKKQLNGDVVILGDYQDMPPFMQIVKLPNPASMSYAHEMLTLCLDRGIQVVYALGEEEQKSLRTAEQLFTEFEIKILNTK